jgi:AcrR family transcriptional regulator
LSIGHPTCDDVYVPVERLTPERRRQLTRDALIAAAAEIFTEKGFHAASLDEIAERAGFTRGAIYSNFGSKDELLFAVGDRYNDLALTSMADAIGETGTAEDPAHAASAAADRLQNLFFRPGELMALDLEFRLYALRYPEGRKRLAERDRKMSETLASFLEEVFAPRTISSQRAQELADLGRAAVDGLEQLAAIDEERASYFKGLVSLLFTLLAKGVSELPPEEPDASETTDESPGPARVKDTKNVGRD